MSERYLLECKCGRQLTVESGDAGRRMRCACGNGVEAPALRALRKLPRAAEAESAATPTWSRRAQFTFVGIVTIVTAGVLAGYMAWTRPESPREELKARAFEELARQRQRIDQGSVAEVRTEFIRLARDNLRGVAAQFDTLVEQTHEQQVAFYNQWMTVFGVVIVLGIALVAGANIAGAASQKRGMPKPAADKPATSKRASRR